jgi:hypothetical protein
VALAAAAQDVVDQLFHREITVAQAGRGAAPLAAHAARQHEMVHSADTGQFVAQAYRHTTAQHGDQNIVRPAGDHMRARIDLDEVGAVRHGARPGGRLALARRS